MMIPLRALLLEIATALELNYSLPATICCTVFEDNNGAYLLATNQKITSRTKYYAVKWHHFWSQVHPKGPFRVEKISITMQRADYLTKGLPHEVFEFICKLNQGW